MHALEIMFNFLCIGDVKVNDHPVIVVTEMSWFIGLMFRKQ